MKRPSEEESKAKAAKTAEDDGPSKIEPMDEEMGEFEDPYGDDFESEDDDEDEIFEAGENGEPDREDEDEDGGAGNGEEVEVKHSTRVYIPHLTAPLGENEVMEPDYSTYNMLHGINVKWPSLSFDILPDHLGNERKTYPQSIYVVTGTQAKRPKDNEITVLKFSSLAKTLVKEDDDEEDSDDDSYDTDPVLETKSIPTKSTTNRIRVNPFAGSSDEYLVASMAEDGQAHIWDVTSHMHSFDRPGTLIDKAKNSPMYTIKAHGSNEGYAVDWSPLISSGAVLTGDISGKIFQSTRTTSGWVTEKQPFLGSEGSVEELQWSPTEKTVFAGAGSDGHIRIWDNRQASRKPALSVKVSETDVNVMSWNRKAAHLLASGHDDGSWGVWDLRTFTTGEPVAEFKFHKSPITSIEFHPTEEPVVAVGSDDNTVTLWDLSVEADDEEISQQAKEAGGDLDNIPSQLLFVHWQPNVKEVHWHKQIPGTLVSTGSEGFSLWNTISI